MASLYLLTCWKMNKKINLKIKKVAMTSARDGHKITVRLTQELHKITVRLTQELHKINVLSTQDLQEIDGPALEHPVTIV